MKNHPFKFSAPPFGHTRALQKRGALQSGFTILEIIMAMTILVLIVGTAYSALTEIVRTKKILDDERDVNLISNAVVNRLARELQLAIAEPGKGIIEPNQNPDDPNRKQIQLLGKPESDGLDLHRDSITFIAQEGGQYVPDGGTHTGLVQVSYRVAKDPEKQDPNSKLLSLIREEIPYPRMSTDPNRFDPDKRKDALQRSFKSRMVFPITDRLVSFQVRYLEPEKNEWVSEWGESNDGLPRMIKFSLVILSPAGRELRATTAVPLGEDR